MCTSPDSLPPFESDTATSLPSGDGTNQSMASCAFLSISLGSTRTRGVARLAGKRHDDEERLLLGRLTAQGEHRLPANGSGCRAWSASRP